MTYEAVLYHLGPLTAWAGIVHENDVLGRRRIPSRWLAIRWAHSIWSQLNPAVVGYVILSEDGREIFAVHAPGILEARAAGP